MVEYIVDFRGIGTTLVYLAKTKPPFLWSKCIRALHTKERIVRCRDCKFAKWKANDCDGNEIYRCDRQIYCEVTADGFCAWGERK